MWWVKLLLLLYHRHCCCCFHCQAAATTFPTATTSVILLLLLLLSPLPLMLPLLYRCCRSCVTAAVAYLAAGAFAHTAVASAVASAVAPILPPLPLALSLQGKFNHMLKRMSRGWGKRIRTQVNMSGEAISETISIQHDITKKKDRSWNWDNLIARKTTSHCESWTCSYATDICCHKLTWYH